MMIRVKLIAGNQSYDDCRDKIGYGSDLYLFSDVERCSLQKREPFCYVMNIQPCCLFFVPIVWQYYHIPLQTRVYKASEYFK